MRPVIKSCNIYEERENNVKINVHNHPAITNPYVNTCQTCRLFWAILIQTESPKQRQTSLKQKIKQRAF